MFTGEQIRKKRKAQGMSAEDLANYLKVNKENLYKWERGHKPNNAHEYIKIENWLAGKMENVPVDNTNHADVNPDYIVKNDVHIKLSDYISLLKEKAEKAEERERDYKEMLDKVLDDMATSLVQTLAYAEETSLQVNAASTVALKSLARQEKRQEESLIEEASKERAHLWKKREKLRTDAGKDKLNKGIQGS